MCWSGIKNVDEITITFSPTYQNIYRIISQYKAALSYLWGFSMTTVGTNKDVYCHFENQCITLLCRVEDIFYNSLRVY